MESSLCLTTNQEKEKKNKVEALLSAKQMKHVLQDCNWLQVNDILNQ